MWSNFARPSPIMRLFQKILASFLLSFGFVCLLISISGIWSKDAKERESLVMAGLMFGVPPTALGGWLFYSLKESSQREERDRLRSAFFQLLQQGNGRITPLGFAMATGLDGAAAKAYLDERAKEFNANFDVGNEGDIAYRFDAGINMAALSPTHLQVPAKPALTGQEVAFGAAATFDVILETVPSNRKIDAIKAVRELTQLGLKEAKDLVEMTPTKLCQRVDETTAQKCKRQLEAIGATVMLIEN